MPGSSTQSATPRSQVHPRVSVEDVSVRPAQAKLTHTNQVRFGEFLQVSTNLPVANAEFHGESPLAGMAIAALPGVLAEEAVRQF